MMEHCRKLICSWTEMTSEEGVSKGGVPHQREILGRACRAALNHIKACAGTPLAAAADGVWCVTGMIFVGRSTSFMSTIFLLWLTASHVTPHILLTRACERRNMSGVLTGASHTHSPSTQPPPHPSLLLSCLRACIHTRAHTILHVTWAVTLEVLGFDRKSIWLTDECSYVWPGRK